MIQFGHETLESTPDVNGNCHRLCIDYSSKRHTHFTVYCGKIFSFAKNKYSDPRHEQKCVAKFPTNGHGTKQWAMMEIKNSMMARAASSVFMKTVKEHGWQLCFIVPQYAILDTVTTFVRKRCENEYVVFEDKLPNCTTFVDSCGKIVTQTSCRNRNTQSKNKKHTSKNSQDMLKSCSPCCNLKAAPAQTHILTPTAPPCHEVFLPSYEQLFGSCTHQTVTSDSNNSTSANNTSSSYNCMYNSSLSNYNINVSDVPDFSPPPYSEHDTRIYFDCNHFPLPTTDSLPCNEETVFDEDGGNPHALLTAFIHFDFYQAEGQRIVCNLKGTCHQGQRYTLTTPTIHSLTGGYGSRDEGEAGMTRVIDNHVCCRWCRHLPSMQQIFQQAQVIATLNMR